MEESTYDQIVRSILFSESGMHSLPDGITISPLCIGKIDDVLCDCFIAYFKSSKPSSTCKVIRIDVLNDRLVDCKDDELYVSEKQEEFPGAEQYMKLYPQVRGFAFSDHLSSEQKDIVRQFITAWLNCCDINIQEKLKEAFPEFYIWCQPFLAD